MDGISKQRLNPDSLECLYKTLLMVLGKLDDKNNKGLMGKKIRIALARAETK